MTQDLHNSPHCGQRIVPFGGDSANCGTKTLGIEIGNPVSSLSGHDHGSNVMRDDVERFRARPAGVFILRLFADDRRARPG